jgi:hypothetical protein
MTGMVIPMRISVILHAAVTTIVGGPDHVVQRHRWQHQTT